MIHRFKQSACVCRMCVQVCMCMTAYACVRMRMCATACVCTAHPALANTERIAFVACVCMRHVHAFPSMHARMQTQSTATTDNHAYTQVHLHGRMVLGMREVWTEDWAHA